VQIELPQSRRRTKTFLRIFFRADAKRMGVARQKIMNRTLGDRLLENTIVPRQTPGAIHNHHDRGEQTLAVC
jgi:hypothetical protein